MTRTILATTIAALAVTGCVIGESESSYTVAGVNASDHDVLVTIRTSAGGSQLLRAMTGGTLFVSSYGKGNEILGSEVDCRPIATLAWVPNDVIVWVAKDGSISIGAPAGEVAPSGLKSVEMAPLDPESPRC